MAEDRGAPESLEEVTKRHLTAVGDLIDAFHRAYVIKEDLESPNRIEVFGDLETESILAAIN